MTLKFSAAVIALFFGASAQSNPAHTQIAGMSEAQRSGFMANYLTKSGETCSGVSRTFYQGADSRGNAFWNVACRGGKSFQLMIENNDRGSIKMMDCGVLKALNAGTCFQKFK